MSSGYPLAMLVAGIACWASAAHGADRPPRAEYSWPEQYGCERAEFNVAGRRGFVILPPEKKRSKSMPWVWYAPTFMGGRPNESNGWICERLLARGIAVCGVDVGESYGNPRGRAEYTEFRKFVIAGFGLSRKPCLWAQSRGGLMLFNWAAEHPALVQCIGGTYAVCDLASYPGLATACSAYGMTESELRSHLSEHNPIDRLAPLAARKVPIFLIHGDSDTVVPVQLNSGKVARRYKALGGPVELQAISGKGHAETPEFFESQKMVDFFVRRSKR